MRKVVPLAAASVLLAACATQPEAAGGDQNLPSDGVGPFRALVAGEMGSLRVAPDGLDDSRDYARDIAVLDADGDPSTLGVVAYVAAAVSMGGMDPTPASPTQSILAYSAPDGRTFGFAGQVVLSPDAAWEGMLLKSPAAVRPGGAGAEVFLYYAAAGGIGLAKSADGMTFTKTGSPVLGPVSGGWEQGAAPASPGVVVLPDGTFRMFYEVALGTAGSGSAIGEATSTDGVSWTRLGDGPALSPSGGADTADAGDGGDRWDSVAVGSPYPQVAVSAAGRTILRVFYGALDGEGNRTVAVAARYGTEGALVRSVSPVFGTGQTLAPREPCVVAFGAISLLYVTQGASSTDTHPVIAVGVTPATAVLPAPAGM